MITANGWANNMSHVVKTERTSDFLLWYSSVEVWDTPNSSALKSSFEWVDQKSIDDLSFISTVIGNTNLFCIFLISSGDARNIFRDFVLDWCFTSYESKIPKFIELRFTFQEESFQCFVNTFRILTLLALTRLSCLKGLQLKFSNTFFTSDVNCCWNAGVSSWWGSTVWDLEGLLIPSSNSLNKRTSSGPEVHYYSKPLESSLFNRWVAPPSILLLIVLLVNLIWCKAWKIPHSFLKRSVEFFIQARSGEF